MARDNMVNKDDASLQYLQQKINDLAEKSKQHQQVNISDAFFDVALFHPSIVDKGYQSYIDEIQDNHQKLAQLVQRAQANSSSNYLQQIAYLAEKITNQITALSRELATYKTRTTNRVAQTQTQTLFTKHAQYLDYLRRLKRSKLELEAKYRQSPSDETKENIKTLNQRIQRCQDAIVEVENEMEQM